MHTLFLNCIYNDDHRRPAYSFITKTIDILKKLCTIGILWGFVLFLQLVGKSTLFPNTLHICPLPYQNVCREPSQFERLLLGFKDLDTLDVSDMIRVKAALGM